MRRERPKEIAKKKNNNNLLLTLFTWEVPSAPLFLQGGNFVILNIPHKNKLLNALLNLFLFSFYLFLVKSLIIKLKTSIVGI